MEAKLKELFLKYRIDFSNEKFYTDFGIREEDFEKLIKEIMLIK